MANRAPVKRPRRRKQISRYLIREYSTEMKFFVVAVALVAVRAAV